MAAARSAARFQPSRTARLNRMGSLSISLAHLWQTQIPFEESDRCSGERSFSYLGPPGDAAEICAATPILTAPDGSACGPLVAWRHSGFEHTKPTRLASNSFVDEEKSSRIGRTFRPSCLTMSIWFLYNTLGHPTAEIAISLVKTTHYGGSTAWQEVLYSFCITHPVFHSQLVHRAFDALASPVLQHMCIDHRRFVKGYRLCGCHGLMAPGWMRRN